MYQEIGQNIQGDLMGIDGLGLGTRHPSRGSRAEFEKHIRSIPSGVITELKKGSLKLGDELIYSIKPVGNSQTIKLFQTQDQKEIGLRNVSNGKLPKNQVMMVSGVMLLAGEAPASTPGSPTEDEMKATFFRTIDSPQFAALATGEFELKANSKTIVPATSMRTFCTGNNFTVAAGYHKLHNPRPISDDVLIEATVELGTTLNLPQDTIIYLGLFGTITTP